MAASVIDFASSLSSAMEVESTPTILSTNNNNNYTNTSNPNKRRAEQAMQQCTSDIFRFGAVAAFTRPATLELAGDESDMMELATYAAAAAASDVRAAAFEDMPEELVYLIFTFLHGCDIANGVQKVCRNWRRLALDDQLWLDLLRRAQMEKTDELSTAWVGEDELRKPAHKSWRWLYQSRHLLINDLTRVGAMTLVGRHETSDFVYEGEWKDGKHHGHGRKIWKSVKSESEAKEEAEGAALAEGDNGAPGAPAQADAAAPADNDEAARLTALQQLGGGQSLPKRSGAAVPRRRAVLPYYEGEWVEGKEHGKGKRLFEEDHYYIGEWRQSEREGFGFYHWPNKTCYEGEFKEGFRHGHGTYTWSEKAKYVGHWQKGIEHGQGVRTWADGDRYEGDWEHGTRTGHGTYTWPNGSSYEGKWLQCAHEGFGVYQWPDGRTYKGNFSANKKHGLGEYFWPDGAAFTGQWRNGVRHGDGTMSWADGARFHGEWAFDRRADGRYTATDGRQVPHSLGATWAKKYDYYFAMPMDMWEHVYLPEINRLIRERKQREADQQQLRLAECAAKGQEDSRPWAGRA